MKLDEMLKNVNGESIGLKEIMYRVNQEDVIDRLFDLHLKKYDPKYNVENLKEAFFDYMSYLKIIGYNEKKSTHPHALVVYDKGSDSDPRRSVKLFCKENKNLVEILLMNKATLMSLCVPVNILNHYGDVDLVAEVLWSSSLLGFTDKEVEENQEAIKEGLSKHKVVRNHERK